MAFTQDKVLELAKSFLKQASGKHSIRSAYLFGSYVRGTQKDYSDIDIALVMPRINESKRYLEESQDIFHEAQEFNSLLEVVCFREDEFEEGQTAIVNQIKKEGIRIELS